MEISINKYLIIFFLWDVSKTYLLDGTPGKLRTVTPSNNISKGITMMSKHVQQLLKKEKKSYGI